MGTTDELKPAFYALKRGGWRDYVTLLHPPYTLWHLTYVAVGAALAPQFHLDRMLWAIAAFFLAMGVAAHALDELHGRPLKTQIPGSALIAIAAVSLGGAIAIGIGAAAAWGWGLLVFVGAGAVLVPAYNLELGLSHGLGLRVVLGRVSRADRLFRRGADPASRGARGRGVCGRAQPRPARAVDARARGAPPTLDDRGNGGARARPATARLRFDVDRRRSRGGPPTMTA